MIGDPARPIDQAQSDQRRASDPTMNAFVAANAGSGKTRVLVDRVVRLLLAGAEPDRILCLTYTKAAASEMLDRLFKKLGDWSILPDRDLAEALSDLDAKGVDLGAARALFARALETPGGLKIETIHAFCTRLLRRFPLEAGVAPGFATLEERETRRLAREARRRVGESVDADRGGDLAAAYDTLAAWVSDSALDAFLDALAGSLSDYQAAKDCHGGFDGLLALAAERLGVDPRAGVEAVKAGAWRAIDHAGLRRCAALLEGAGGTRDQARGTAIRAALNAGDPVTGDPSTGFDALVEALFTGKAGEGEPYKAFATKKLAETHPILDQLLGAEGGYGSEVLKMDAARAQVHAALCFDLTKAGFTIAEFYIAAFEREKARIGALDFADLIACARRLLSTSEAAQWTLFKLDGGIDHILVDEAQDTSPEQWDVIKALTVEFFAGAGVGGPERRRTVFAVGDEKQSIYGFQGARPERFLETQHWIELQLSEPERTFVAPSLVVSFRSAPAILRAVDAVFDDDAMSIMLPRNRPPGAEGASARHVAVRDDIEGAVEWWPAATRAEREPQSDWWEPVDAPASDSPAERLARGIAAEVRRWIDAGEVVNDKSERGGIVARALKPGDIIILVRSRGPLFERLIPALKKAGVPVAGADRLTLAAELAVEDLLGAARVGLAPDDDLALAEFLKSPLLHPVAAVEPPIDEASLFALAHKRSGSLKAALDASGDPRLAEARALVATLVARARRQTPFAFLAELMEAASATGESYARRLFKRAGAEAEDPVEALLDRALAHERAGAPSLERFVAEIAADALQIKRDGGEAQEAVRVMTIHGSKGLEAPIVILADAADPGRGEAAERPFVDLEAGVLWSPIAKLDPPEAALRRAARESARDAEDLRLLYVALTRARDRLVVCGAARERGDPTRTWHARVEGALRRLGAEPLETPFGEGLRFGRPAGVGGARETKAAHAIDIPAWTGRAPEPEPGRARVLSPSLIGEGSRAGGAPVLSPLAPDAGGRLRRGRLIHKLLERLPDLAATERPAAARRFLDRHGVAAADASAWTEEALALISDPAFAAVFAPGSRAEASIAGLAPELGEGVRIEGRVDRLAVTGDAVLVIDYKTDRPPPSRIEAAEPAYIEQLALYRAVLRRAFPGRVVQCGLIWTFTPALMSAPDSLLDAAFARLTERAALHT